VELSTPLRVADFAQGLEPRRSRGDVSSFADVSSACVASEASQRFGDVRRRTQCVFAPRALVWGNDWQEDCDGEAGGDALAANVARCLPRIYRFCLEVRAGQPLDGFVFEARGAKYGADVASFGQTVRRVLTTISAADPAGVDCMRKGYIGKRGWYFQFAREPLFVTSFAPCYPPSNPRHQFGLHPDSCFILLQPEESFLRHDLPADKPRSATNWDDPQDVRDRIRTNFRRQGREYRIPETTAYPPAEFIVAPFQQLSDPPVEFWKPPSTGRA